jgi:hypothetical protein
VAEALFAQALELMQRTYPSRTHVNVAAVHQKLGLLYVQRGKSACGNSQAKGGGSSRALLDKARVHLLTALRTHEKICISVFARCIHQNVCPSVTEAVVCLRALSEVELATQQSQAAVGWLLHIRRLVRRSKDSKDSGFSPSSLTSSAPALQGPGFGAWEEPAASDSCSAPSRWSPARFAMHWCHIVPVQVDHAADLCHAAP